MSDKVLAVTRQIVNHRNLYHCVASRLLTHGSTCRIDKHLCSERRVVDFHIELKHLIMSLSRDTLACQVDTMTDIIEGVHTLHLEDMSLVIDEYGSAFIAFTTSSNTAPSSSST